VTTPEPARVAETLAFRQELLRGELPLAGLIVNRVLPAALVTPALPEAYVESPEDVALARKLAAVHRRYARLHEQERAEIARLTGAAPDLLRVELPLQPTEPTAITRLAELAELL
jgi:hypothetical protein